MITSQGQSICNVGDIAHHHVISVETPRKAFAYDTDGKQGVDFAPEGVRHARGPARFR